MVTECSCGCSSEIEVDVPCSVAYDCYSDRETIPQWMPFISSVKVLANFLSLFVFLWGQMPDISHPVLSGSSTIFLCTIQ